MEVQLLNGNQGKEWMGVRLYIQSKQKKVSWLCKEERAVLFCAIIPSTVKTSSILLYSNHHHNHQSVSHHKKTYGNKEI